MRTIDFLACSRCDKTFASAQNCKRHIATKCKDAEPVHTPMEYVVNDDRLDVSEYLYERATPFPNATGNHATIANLATAWGAAFAETLVSGDMYAQLAATFAATWSKTNTLTPHLKNVYRHDRSVYVLRANLDITRPDAPPDVTKHPDVTETFETLAYELFVMHRTFVLDTRLPDSTIGDKTTWSRYNDQSLPGVPGSVLACRVDGYEPWMSRVADMIRRGIPTYRDNVAPPDGTWDTISVAMCTACGWSHPEPTRVRSHMKTCRYRTQDDAEPVKRNASIRKFNASTVRIAKRKRCVDDTVFVANRVPITGCTDRVRREYTTTELADVAPSVPATTDPDDVMDAFVLTFDKLFGKSALEPRFASVFFRNGAIVGLVAFDDETGEYRTRMKKLAPLELVSLVVSTVSAVWMKAHPDRVLDILRVFTEPYSGVAFTDVQADWKRVATTHSFPPVWQNMVAKLKAVVPFQSEILQ